MGQNKKAAMFGLDARIALAIFGALSIITGATLYSAIQNSKTTALLIEMQEVGKAWEQYYLDTAISLVSSSSEHINIENLIKNTVNSTNWKGPYITASEKSNNRIISATKYNGVDKEFSLYIGKDSTWDIYNQTCVSAEPCFIWVGVSTTLDISDVAKRIDIEIDKVDNNYQGNFRWVNYSTRIGTLKFAGTTLYYKYAAIKNPHD